MPFVSSVISFELVYFGGSRPSPNTSTLSFNYYIVFSDDFFSYL